MHDEVKKAIFDAARENGCSDSVAHQLIAWFENVINGNESMDNPTKIDERLGLLVKAMPESDLVESNEDEDI